MGGTYLYVLYNFCLLLLLEPTCRFISLSSYQSHITHCYELTVNRTQRELVTFLSQRLLPWVSVGFLVTYPLKCDGFYAMHAQITVGATPPGYSE